MLSALNIHRRLIERHSTELAAELVAKLGTSPRADGLGKVPVDELGRQIEESSEHLSEWLLAKTGHDIEQRFLNWVSATHLKGSRSPTPAVRLL